MVCTLDAFRAVVAEGATIVVKEEGREAAQTVVAATGPALSRAPLTVLVDGDTASAAEILAGAHFQRGLPDRVYPHRMYPTGSVLRLSPTACWVLVKLSSSEGRCGTDPVIHRRHPVASHRVSLWRTGALKDNCRGLLVGSRTYGKGLIQSIYELHDASGLALTVRPPCTLLTPHTHMLSPWSAHPANTSSRTPWSPPSSMCCV